MNRKELIEHIEEQDKEIFDLIARVIFCIEIIGWDEEDNFTFPDGETWSRFDPDFERAKNIGKGTDYVPRQLPYDKEIIDRIVTDHKKELDNE